MPDPCSFRQVDEKHVANEVERMLWSPKMDLIAVANVLGEVLLYRLSWQKVWTLASQGEKVKVNALAWRSDGKVLAVGYETGKVLLCDVENSNTVHSLDIPGHVTCMTWVTEEADTSPTEEVSECFTEQAVTYLPRLLPFAKSYNSLTKGQSEENVEDPKRLKGQTDLNLMLVGSDSSHVYIYAYGIFPVATVKITPLWAEDQPSSILSCTVSEDLRMLSVVVERQLQGGMTETSLHSFDTSLLASHRKELRILALKYGQVAALISYLESTLHQMSEAWEDILLEMDSKLLKFADQKATQGSGTISNDFLELLMLGTPSSDLQAFLLHELTEKGLKKLGHSIETSYSNIQKLVLKHLQCVSQALVYHLNDLKGMSAWYDKFGVLGLSTPGVQKAVTMAGSFMLKSSELQQVIDGSMKNFKAFFRWLYVVIQRLSDEPIPPELSKMTQQDLNFVATFLRENFTESSECEDGSPRFKLERVGQYLKREDLQDPPDNSGNPFVQFLQSSTHLKECSLLYPDYHEKSLVGLHEEFISTINAALNSPSHVIGRSLVCTSVYPLYRRTVSNSSVRSRISQYSVCEADGGHYVYLAYTVDELPCDKCYIIRQKTDVHSMIEVSSALFGELANYTLDSSIASLRCSRHKILDLSFYDQETLSFLLQEDTDEKRPVLVQIRLSSLNDDQKLHVRSQMECPVPVSDMEDLTCIDLGLKTPCMNHRTLENMKASCFAVSGTRKVACVLFASRRRVRLFLMDVEEEEDEDEDEEDVDGHYSSRNENEADESRDDDEEDKENTRESDLIVL